MSSTRCAIALLALCLLAPAASACSLRQLLSSGCGGAAAKSTQTAPVYLTTLPAIIGPTTTTRPASVVVAVGTVRTGPKAVIPSALPAATTTTPAPVAKAAATTVTAAAQPTASYPTLTEAVGVGAKAPNLSTLFAVINAAGVAGALKPDTAWTILAPTNEAFEARIKKDLNTTPAELLKNKEALVKVLSYHVIPTAAVASSQLKDGQTVATALEGAAPLKVSVTTGKDGKAVVQFVGATNTAQVVAADIKAGKTYIHVIDDVLLPAGVGKTDDADK